MIKVERQPGTRVCWSLIHSASFLSFALLEIGRQRGPEEGYSRRCKKLISTFWSLSNGLSQHVGDVTQSLDTRPPDAESTVLTEWLNEYNLG